MNPQAAAVEPVFAEQLERVYSLVGKARLVATGAALCFAGILWGDLPHTVVLVWLFVTFLATEGAPFLARFRARAPDPYARRWYTILVAVMTAGGLAWGVGAGIAIALAPDPAVKMSAIAFIIGVAGANVVFNSPFKLPFWTMQLGLLLPAMTAELSTGIPLFQWMAASAVVELVFSWVLHRHTHNALVDSITARQRLAHQAHHDPLTGLPNRAALTHQLDEVLAGGEKVGVLFIDLDRFKVVNDSLGHDVGDQLLIAVTHRLGALIRPLGQLYRVGGDELIALLPRPADDAEVERVAHQVHATLRQPIRFAGRELPITASIGIAHGPAAGDTGRDVLRYADAALYRAKDRGRDRVEVFDDGMRAALRRRVDDEQALRRALDRGEIEPWYQPIVDLHTGMVVGGEALARWRHPERGVLAAGSFIPLLEESGLAGRLTDVMVGRVIADIASWRHHRLRHVRVKVNLGAEPFARPNLASWLAELMRAHRCPSDALGVEVTETSLLTDLGLAAEHLRALRANGLTVALDDFGTAWSSLALLRQLPLDTVKIDRMFLRDITEREEDRALVGAVVTLARQFHLSVVAEGIETRAQARVAAELGCDTAQGYLYAPAVPADEFVRILGADPFPVAAPLAAAADQWAATG